MQSLFCRPSGIYVFRISVPVLLRPIFGRREVVATTGSSELTIAKIVAGTQAAQWHQRFFDSRRLMSLLGTPEVLAPYVNSLAVTPPTIASFDLEVGLSAVKDALRRKNAGRGATEDIDGSQ